MVVLDRIRLTGGLTTPDPLYKGVWPFLDVLRCLDCTRNQQERRAKLRIDRFGGPLVIVPMEHLDGVANDYLAVFFGTKPLLRVEPAVDGTAP
jgi:hypothetical protein